MAHTKRTRDVSVMCRRMTHSGESETGASGFTHLGVEKPPGKSQVGAGHRYCLGQHFLSMWQIYSGGWNSCFIQAQSFSICNASFSLALIRTHKITHKRVPTHIYTHTHLPACRQSHFISINTIFLLLHLTQNRHTHYCPAYKCRKCAVNTTKLGICNFDWDQQLMHINKHTKLKIAPRMKPNHTSTKMSWWFCGRIYRLIVAAPPQHLLEVSCIVRQYFCIHCHSLHHCVIISLR